MEFTSEKVRLLQKISFSHDIHIFSCRCLGCSGIVVFNAIYMRSGCSRCVVRTSWIHSLSKRSWVIVGICGAILKTLN